MRLAGSKTPGCDGRFRFGLALVAMAVLIPSAGCGESPPPTYPVSGTVKYDNQLVETGMIEFDPVDVPQAPESAPIVNGKYQLNAKPGKNRVRITADRQTGAPDPVMGVAPRESYIPAKYNSQTVLSKVVSESGPNEFDFDLTGDAAP